MRVHLVPALGSKRLDAISNEAVQLLKGSLASKAPKTVNNVLTVLSVALKKAVADEHGCRIVLSEYEENVSLQSALADCKPPLALALGPEGGWTQDEAGLFTQSGWVAASLGGTVLRAETAAIAAVAVAMALTNSGTSV